MDIQKERMNLNCRSCGEDFVATFNTSSCPKCGIDFEENEIKKIFYDYESQLVNNPRYMAGEKLEKISSDLNNASKSTASFGCLTTLGCTIPIIIVILFFLFM
ncbi:MAG: hypothetical protein ACTH8E_08645 [Brochothrix thermosphacta]|uniref:hypothetical protein n=1 Tax=Brochothrix thermosphacta TaxID=2756 RepID=UPI003F935D5B